MRDKGGVLIPLANTYAKSIFIDLKIVTCFSGQKSLFVKLVEGVCLKCMRNTRASHRKRMHAYQGERIVKFWQYFGVSNM